MAARHPFLSFTADFRLAQDLSNLLDTIPKPFTANEVKCLMWQLLQGVSFLHRNYMIHR